MGQIVWLASYPKSGNTWVRMLLNSYFFGAENRQDLNSLDLSTFGGSSKSSYRAVTDADIDACTDAQIMALTPGAHAYIASRQPGFAFVKTHNLLSDYQDIPLITAGVTRAAIYILRNPLDMVISVADHFGLTLDRAIDFINDTNGSTAPTDQMVRQIFCSWSYNVASWTTSTPFPVWIVRYEDLHKTPEKCLQDILLFLDSPVDAKRISAAVKRSSFKSLKAMERRDGFSEKSQHSKSFFRSGKTGQWRHKLTADQVRRIVVPNYELMKRFGYLPQGY